MAAPKLAKESQLASGTGALSPVGAARPLTARVGKYEVEAEIKEGSAVQVLQGLDRDTGRPVTLKVLADITDHSLQERFRQEVATAAKLHHPAFIAIYELGEHVGLPFAAMQHLAGVSLKESIQAQQPATLLEKMLIMWQVAEGIRAAHRGGISYVGVRPAGIILAGDGTATIQDFGTVRPSQEDREEYTAPEELLGAVTPNPVCDVFVFAVVYYEFLAGRHPFLAGNSGGLIIDIPGGEPAPLHQFAPECPEELERILFRALEKRRELRYQSLEDLQFDIEPMLRDLKRERAASLLTDVKRLAAEEALDEAQRVLREVLDLDPDSREAHQIHASIRSQVQRQTVRRRIESLHREAESETQARNFQRAIECLKSVLELEPGNAAARDLLNDVQSHRERSDRADRLMAEARDLLAQQNLQEAKTKLTQALEEDPETPGGRDLLQLMDTLRQRHEAEAEIERGLASAKSLLLVESFDEALELLDALWAKHPQFLKIDHWRTHVRTQKIEVERKNRLETLLARTRALMDERRFGDASDLLERISEEFPGEQQLRDLRKEVRTSMTRANAVGQALDRCEELRRASKLDEALEVLESALVAYPDEPAIIRARGDLASQKDAIQTAATVRAALQELRWLLDKDRPDLAAQFLKDKLEELPGDATLLARLAEIEESLPRWQQHRLEQEAISRASILEEKQQWTVALTVLEEALKASPDSTELAAAVERFRERIRDQERQKKLGRRLEAIRQRIEGKAWLQALSLIESAQREFPREPELKRLADDAQAGLKRSESEAIAVEVRQYLADGEIGQAEAVLQRALESRPSEPALDALRQELEGARKFQEDWREAQVLFGRGRLEEAEAILSRIAGPGRPEVQALLDTVQSGRTPAAVPVEEVGPKPPEKQPKLSELSPPSDVDDVLREFLSHFPDDPLLEQELLSAQNKLEHAPARPPVPQKPPEPQAAKPSAIPDAPPAAPPAPEPARTAAAVAVPTVAPSPAPVEAPIPEARPASRRWLLVAIVVIAIAGVWALLRRSPSSPKPQAAPAAGATAPAAQPQEFAAPNPVSAQATVPVKSSAPTQSRQRTGTAEPSPSREPTRVFVPPTRVQARSDQVALPAPPGNTVSIAAGGASPLPLGLGQSVKAPPAPAPQPAEQPAQVVGGRLEQAEVVSQRLPQLPEFARARGISGAVKLEATVDKSGAVTNVKVLAGDPVLAAAARTSVMQWKYRPAKLNGQPIATTIAITVDFKPVR